MVNYLLYVQALIVIGIYLLPKIKYVLELKKIFIKDDFWNNISVDKTKQRMIWGNTSYIEINIAF